MSTYEITTLEITVKVERAGRWDPTEIVGRGPGEEPVYSIEALAALVGDLIEASSPWMAARVTCGIVTYDVIEPWP